MAGKMKNFSYNPTNISVPRTKFRIPFNHKTSFKLGELVPIACVEVLPGDTFAAKVASVVRMSSPIAPIMDNIHIDYFPFFVPMRLVWEHWEEFCGANKTGPWANLTEYTVPSAHFDEFHDSIDSSSVGNYFGIPIHSYVNGGTSINVLPLRAYCLIWNEWFRDENVQTPLIIDTGDLGFVTVGDTYDYSYACLKAAKFHDYFTSCLPAPQKGASVTLPLGGTAPILSATGDSSWLKAADSNGVDQSLLLKPTAQLNPTYAVGANLLHPTVAAGYIPQSSYVKPNLVADLSNATAATINEIRYAFQLQKLLEKDARGGTRYFEMLQTHFGVTSPDLRLQRPEFLGGVRFPINIEQVTSTAGATDDTGTKLGQPGANSVTPYRNGLFTKSFTEFGYVIVLAVARQDNTYSQGLHRMFSRQHRFDFYYPVFANVGEQLTRNREIFLQDTDEDNEGFGYQEAWAEYRYLPARVSGILNPNDPASLDYWTLAYAFASKPTLGTAFIESTRSAISRALVSATNGPDFIIDFLLDIEAVREMPLYSIPGLIDHF